MKINKKSLCLIFSILLTLYACNAPIATQTVIPLSTASTTPAIESTPREWLPFNPDIVNTGECEKLTSTTIPIAGMENSSNEEVTRKLFMLFLEKHITLDLHHFCKLESYKIEKITSDIRIDFLAKEQGVDFVDWVIYSVQIAELPSIWVAANGEFAPNGWIANKAIISGVSKANNEYKLKLIGTGP